MDANNIALLYRRAFPKKQIERIFMHDGKFVLEAYPKGESANDRAYCAYYTFDPKTKNFDPYTPMNVSIAETDRFFESAKHKLPFE